MHRAHRLRKVILTFVEGPPQLATPHEAGHNSTIVPPTVNSINRAKVRAEKDSLALHNSAVTGLETKLNQMVASAELWVDVLERGGGMDIPHSFQTLLSVQWALVAGNPAIEQVTFGASSNEGIALDTPASLNPEDGYPPTATELKLRINGSGSAQCRGKWIWDSAHPRYRREQHDAGLR